MKGIKSKILYLISIIIILVFAKLGAQNPKSITKKIQKQDSTALLNAFSKIALLKGKDIHKIFHRKESFYGPKNTVEILYGNKEYGYFKTKKFKINQDKTEVSFIPPGYKYKIFFYAITDNKQRKPLGVRNFNLKIPAVFNKLKIVNKNQFSFPYMIISGVYLPPKQEHKRSHRIAYNLIVNRYGEIVFINIPGNSKVNLSRYGIMKQIAPGKYATLFGEQDSYFEIMDISGKRTSVAPLTLKSKKVIHHDFIIDERNPNEVLVLGNKYASIRGFTTKTTFKEKLKQLIGKPFKYVTTTIDKLNLKTKTIKSLVSLDKFFHPLKNIDLNYKKTLGKSEYIALNEGGIKEWGPGGRYQIDHTHANSFKRIQPTKHHQHDGYILSLRNQNKVIFLDKELKNILWSVGHEENDTYRLMDVKSKFYRQHDATITNEGLLAVYDNHTSPPAPNNRPSRFLTLSFDHKNKVMKFAKHFVPPENVYNPTRGSSEYTKIDTRLIYAPNAIIITEQNRPHSERTRPKDYAYEVDMKNNKILASMIFEYSFFLGGKDFFNYGAGSRAFPIYSIGPERFMGYDFTQN